MDNPDAYVHRALVNAARQRFRRRWSDERPTLVLPDEQVADGVEGRAEREELFAALRMLPLRQRATIVLRYLEQLSEAETAQALGCSVGTVKSQTSRALDALRRTLASEELPC